MEEYSRKGAAMTPRSPDPLSSPPSAASSAADMSQTLPCSCGPEMPDWQNNAHALPRLNRHRTYTTLTREVCVQAHKDHKHGFRCNSISKTNVALCDPVCNYSGLPSPTFVPATPFEHVKLKPDISAMQVFPHTCN